jgi:hypothetical protein
MPLWQQGRLFYRSTSNRLLKITVGHILTRGSLPAEHLKLANQKDPRSKHGNRARSKEQAR